MATTHSWLTPKAYVKKSAKHGSGVFANKTVHKGELVAIFGGDVITIDQINDLPEAMRGYPMQIEGRFCLASTDVIEDTDYFNHSCEPNCGFHGQIFLVAMKNIKPQEEFTFDYAMTISESVGSDVVFEMECQCGKKSCRKKITESDWKKPSLRKKYKGFFSDYLQRQM